MKKKIIIGCIGAAVLLVLLSFNSVVGSDVDSLSERKEYSPLFAVQMNRKINKIVSEEMTSDYIGKGRILPIFTSRVSILHEWIGKAAKLFNEKPALVYALVDKLGKLPMFANILHKNSAQIQDFKTRLNQFKSNPEAFQEELDNAVDNLDLNLPLITPKPLGLSTSSPLACFIVAIAMLPLFLLLAVLIGTMTIVTCLVPGCLESLLEGIFEGFIQGLTPPEYT